ncbi:MAG: helix-turn-helix transcriptional regulator [Aeromicrobium sp.]|uniref:LuxR C-terminal-related transcriptional regulator n=1 Tax=Aeromicrobium sp. TaxID=1871063 RepID=UPI0039E3E28D
MNDRVERTWLTLDGIVTGYPYFGRDDSAADSWSAALSSFEASWLLDHERAWSRAERAVALLPANLHDDPETVVLAYATLALARAGLGLRGDWTDLAPGLTPTGDPLIDAHPFLFTLGPGDAATFARYAMAEAALALGRVSLSHRLLRSSASFADQLAGHHFETVMTVLQVRAAAFAGCVTHATQYAAALSAESDDRLSLLVESTRALVSGYAADPTATHRLTARVEQLRPTRHDRLTSGVALLCAYGLIALGEVRRSAALIGRSGWQRAMVIDRVIAHEFLIHAAIDDGDDVAVAAWLAAAEKQFEGDPIATSTVERCRSRAALFLGDPAAALAAAERSIAAARVDGRAVEAAEGEIVKAHAGIALGERGEVARDLERLIDRTDSTGFRAARRSANRELRGTGRRLRPVRGLGGSALSERERQVRDLLLCGLGTAQIAAELFISTHTTRVHLARVLAAYGVPSRVALARQVARTSGDPDVAAAWLRYRLTSRQRAVARETVAHASTAEIAEALGLSVRTVEKHLTAIMRAWGTDSRLGVVVRAGGVLPRQ